MTKYEILKNFDTQIGYFFIFDEILLNTFLDKNNNLKELPNTKSFFSFTPQIETPVDYEVMKTHSRNFHYETPLRIFHSSGENNRTHELFISTSGIAIEKDNSSRNIARKKLEEKPEIPFIDPLSSQEKDYYPLLIDKKNPIKMKAYEILEAKGYYDKKEYIDINEGNLQIALKQTNYNSKERKKFKIGEVNIQSESLVISESIDKINKRYVFGREAEYIRLNISNGSYPIYEIFNDNYIVNKDDEKNTANNWLNDSRALEQKLNQEGKWNSRWEGEEAKNALWEDLEVENAFNEFKEYYPTDPNIHFLYMEFEGTKFKLK